MEWYYLLLDSLSEHKFLGKAMGGTAKLTALECYSTS